METIKKALQEMSEKLLAISEDFELIEDEEFKRTLLTDLIVCVNYIEKQIQRKDRE
ncbi:hypothetical protein [Helicobacter sp. 12S02232-10]|uniref:hypothetical protein n=1 Tax=Helicobacter sp. 12S02232-10 TaxID=1476197 RepID=UPI0015DD78C6|nr:hypothetical protein [Helicobacter sp. 12S02232-10]